MAQVVLIADDDGPTRLYLADLLQSVGLESVLAANGQEAVAVVTEHEDLACALLDVQMPVLDGISAAKQIRQHKPALPVVLMSGSLPHDIYPRLDGMPVAEILRKPFQKGELQRVILQVVSVNP
jgi:CheY-like chemotaxis protein